jgi:hypothetical protein
MLLYEGRGLGDVYATLLRDLTNEGRRVTVRGQNCMEFKEPVTLVYKNSGYCWMCIPGRKFNPFFSLAEVFQMLSGQGSVSFLSYFNSKIKDIAADEGNSDFHGAYGIRLRKWLCNPYEEGIHDDNPEIVDQIQQALRKLKIDPFSRQAVLSLWDPVQDNLEVSKDYPCNNLVYYSLRDGKLDQTVVQRSNDLVYGTPYNAVQFTHLHALVAGELGTEMGTFTYVIQNMHFYYDLYPKILANLLEWAFVSRSWIEGGEDCALCLPGFCTVTDAEIKKLQSTIEEIANTFKNYPEDLRAPDVVFQRGLGYWNYMIPSMIWIFSAVKTYSQNHSPIVRNDAIEGLTAAIVALGEPLISLIQDFYADSENIFTRALMYSLHESLCNG